MFIKAGMKNNRIRNCRFFRSPIARAGAPEGGTGQRLIRKLGSCLMKLVYLSVSIHLIYTVLCLIRLIRKWMRCFALQRQIGKNDE